MGDPSLDSAQHSDSGAAGNGVDLRGTDDRQLRQTRLLHSKGTTSGCAFLARVLHSFAGHVICRRARPLAYGIYYVRHCSGRLDDCRPGRGTVDPRVAWEGELPPIRAGILARALEVRKMGAGHRLGISVHDAGILLAGGRTCVS